jgi:methylamine--corrinoid protein Co-methyltransferase
MLWLASVYSQALARNTHLLNESVVMAAAGPCTKMLFYEFAAYAIAAVVSGGNLVAGGIARDKYPERVSALEIQAASEVGHLVARMGMRRKEANALVRKLVSKYEKDIPQAPLGRKFSEIYDMEKVKPLPDYEALYEDVREELSGLGLDYGLL